MTQVSELVPFRNEFGDKFLSGESEAAQVVGFWLWLFMPNLEKVSAVLVSNPKGTIDVHSISGLLPCEANYYCNFEIFNEEVFIFDEDLNGFPDRMVVLSPQQFSNILSDYLFCLKIGLKKAEGFLFEYAFEGSEAKHKYALVTS